MKKILPKSLLNLLLKTLLALLLIGALYFDFTAKDNLEELLATFLWNLNSPNWIWLAITVILIPLNYLAETQKWHQFVQRYQPFTLWDAYKAVLGGISFSLFTPNRVGEYGGRMLFVQPKHKWKAIIANMVGNFAQLIVLFSSGLIGALWFVTHFFDFNHNWAYAFVFFSLLGLGLLYFAYFNIDLIIPLIKRIPFVNHVKRFVKDIKVLRHYTTQELFEILVWALIRYLIYSTQYYLLLRFFGIEVNVIHAYLSIAAIFLLQTSIPLPPVMGLLARGNVAIQVWSFFGMNEISILATTFGLWILNLILPALFGTFFIFNVNITKSLGYEDDDV